MEPCRDYLNRFYLCTNRMDGLYYLAARKMGVNENTFSLLYTLGDGIPRSQKRLSEELLSLAGEPMTMDRLCLDYYRKKQLLTTHIEKAALYARNVDAMVEYLVDVGRMDIVIREGVRYFVRA